MPTGVYVRTPEHRAKISASALGRTAWNKGRPATPEMRARISLALTGRRQSPESRAKKSAALTRHGHAPYLAPTLTYKTWVSMKQRCFNPNCWAYSYYGGRGIRVCDRWRESFAAFLEDMGEKPAGKSIDRIDVNGNYEPGNCRWATPAEQRANQREITQ